MFWDEAVALDSTIAARDERNMPLCRQGELAALWRDNGLQRVEELPITIELSFASFDDYWRPFLGGQGPAGAYRRHCPNHGVPRSRPGSVAGCSAHATTGHSRFRPARVR